MVDPAAVEWGDAGGRRLEVFVNKGSKIKESNMKISIFSNIFDS